MACALELRWLSNQRLGANANRLVLISCAMRSRVPLSFATERAMFLTFERLSTRNEAGRHREFRCPRCERWPQLVKLEPNAVRLFECRCGVQIWDRVLIEATSK